MVGRESGFGENHLYNLENDKNFKKLNDYHSELKYDIAVANIMAPNFVDQISISELTIKSYLSFYDSSVFFISKNGINTNKPIEDTAYVRKKIPCDVKGIGYDDGEASGYDPRCREWMKNILRSYENFRANTHSPFGEFEKSIPFIVSPLYRSAETNT